jgi:hypothetical protein
MTTVPFSEYNYSGPPEVPQYTPANPNDFGGFLLQTGTMNRSSEPSVDNAFSTDTSAHGKNRVMETIVAGNRGDDIIFSYQNCPLFIIGENDEALPEQNVYSHWHMNAELKKHALVKDRKRKKRSSSTYNVSSDFPTTKAEFVKNVRFAGYLTGQIHSDPGATTHNSRFDRCIMGSQLRGPVDNVANIWGSNVKAGQWVCFALKTVNIGTDTKARKGWDGNEMVVRDFDDDGEFYEENSCLQLVPVICSAGNAPVGSFSVLDPSFTEAERCDDANEYVNLTFDGKYVDGIFLNTAAVIYPVGVVVRRLGEPADFEVEAGRNSIGGYEHLQKINATLDIQMLKKPRFMWAM